MNKKLFIIFILYITLPIFSSTALSLTYVNYKYEQLPYPDDCNAYLKDATSYIRAGSGSWAVRYINRARQLVEEKNDAQAMGLVAVYYLLANDPDQAFNAYRRGNQLALEWAKTHRDYAMNSLKYLIDLHNNFFMKYPQHSTSQKLAKEATQAAVELETLRNAPNQQKEDSTSPAQEDPGKSKPQPTDLQCIGKWLAGCKEGGTGTEYGYFNLKIDSSALRVYDGNVESKVFKSNYRVSGSIDQNGDMLVQGYGEGGIVTMTGKLEAIESAGKEKYVGRGTFYLQRRNLQGIPCDVYEGEWETDK